MRAAIVAFAFAAVIVIFPIWALTGDTYGGKETFYTNGEYTQLKEELSIEGVGIDELVVASSEPPIVAQFRVFVPRDYEFP